MTGTTLLAKRLSAHLAPVTLEAHLRDTERAAARLFAAGTRWGDVWLRFFKLPPSLQPVLERHLRLAALFHDVGKANAEFQARLHGRQVVQTLRHEHLSALVLALPEIRVNRRRKLTPNRRPILTLPGQRFFVFDVAPLEPA